ncbi:MAG: helix-turn-helix domain-containing protein [Steroidobacteraceae bacterium]
MSPIGKSAESGVIVEAGDLDDEPRLTEWYRAVGIALRRERDSIHESVVSIARGARQDRDVSQESLARTLGWSKSVIVNFENLRRDLGVADFILMAEKSGIEPEELFASVMFHLRSKTPRP